MLIYRGDSKEKVYCTSCKKEIVDEDELWNSIIIHADYTGDQWCKKCQEDYKKLDFIY